MWEHFEHQYSVLSLNRQGLQDLVTDESVVVTKAQLVTEAAKNEMPKFYPRSSVEVDPNSALLTVRLDSTKAKYDLKVRMFDTDELDQIANKLEEHFQPMVRSLLLNGIHMCAREAKYRERDYDPWGAYGEAKAHEDLRDHYLSESNWIRKIATEPIKQIKGYQETGMQIVFTKMDNTRPRVFADTHIMTKEDRVFLKPYVTQIIGSLPKDLGSPFQPKAAYVKLITSF